MIRQHFSIFPPLPWLFQIPFFYFSTNPSHHFINLSGISSTQTIILNPLSTPPQSEKNSTSCEEKHAKTFRKIEKSVKNTNFKPIAKSTLSLIWTSACYTHQLKDTAEISRTPKSIWAKTAKNIFSKNIQFDFSRICNFLGIWDNPVTTASDSCGERRSLHAVDERYEGRKGELSRNLSFSIVMFSRYSIFNKKDFRCFGK